MVFKAKMSSPQRTKQYKGPSGSMPRASYAPRGYTPHYNNDQMNLARDLGYAVGTWIDRKNDNNQVKQQDMLERQLMDKFRNEYLAQTPQDNSITADPENGVMIGGAPMTNALENAKQIVLDSKLNRIKEYGANAMQAERDYGRIQDTFTPVIISKLKEYDATPNFNQHFLEFRQLFHENLMLTENFTENENERITVQSALFSTFVSFNFAHFSHMYNSSKLSISIT